jgi:hypothetical protein
VHRHGAFSLALSSLDASRFRNRVHVALRQAWCDRAIDRRRLVSTPASRLRSFGPPAHASDSHTLNRDASAELGHHRFGDVEVRVDVLDVVELLERLE